MGVPHLIVLSFGLLPVLGGCYAAVGPTIGLDLPTGRATVGVEASAETGTIAHSIALGGGRSEPERRAPPLAQAESNASNTESARQADSRNWSTHTYLLWEPGFGSALGDRTTGRFDFLGGGASVGIRVNRYEGRPMDADLVAGAWASAGHVLSNEESQACAHDDTRPFVALVVGVRGFELYASPKIGLMHRPGFCVFEEGQTY